MLKCEFCQRPTNMVVRDASNIPHHCCPECKETRPTLAISVIFKSSPEEELTINDYTGE